MNFSEWKVDYDREARVEAVRTIREALEQKVQKKEMDLRVSHNFDRTKQPYSKAEGIKCNTLTLYLIQI